MTEQRRQLNIVPSTECSCEIKTIGQFGQVLPTIGVRAFEHQMEIVVVDLAGNPVHQIVIRQNGDVEVD
jgi:hypothetical protein